MVAVCPTCFQRLVNQQSSDDIVYLSQNKGYKVPELPPIVRSEKKGVVGQRLIDPESTGIYVVTKVDEEKDTVILRNRFNDLHRASLKWVLDHFAICDPTLFSYL